MERQNQGAVRKKGENVALQQKKLEISTRASWEKNCTEEVRGRKRATDSENVVGITAVRMKIFFSSTYRFLLFCLFCGFCFDSKFVFKSSLPKNMWHVFTNDIWVTLSHVEFHLIMLYISSSLGTASALLWMCAYMFQVEALEQRWKYIDNILNLDTFGEEWTKEAFPYMRLGPTWGFPLHYTFPYNFMYFRKDIQVCESVMLLCWYCLERVFVVAFYSVWKLIRSQWCSQCISVIKLLLLMCEFWLRVKLEIRKLER